MLSDTNLLLPGRDAKPSPRSNAVAASIFSSEGSPASRCRPPDCEAIAAIEAVHGRPYAEVFAQAIGVSEFFRDADPAITAEQERLVELIREVDREHRRRDLETQRQRAEAVLADLGSAA